MNLVAGSNMTIGDSIRDGSISESTDADAGSFVTVEVEVEVVVESKTKFGTDRVALEFIKLELELELKPPVAFAVSAVPMVVSPTPLNRNAYQVSHSTLCLSRSPSPDPRDNSPATQYANPTHRFVQSALTQRFNSKNLSNVMFPSLNADWQANSSGPVTMYHFRQVGDAPALVGACGGGYIVGEGGAVLDKSD